MTGDGSALEQVDPPPPPCSFSSGIKVERCDAAGCIELRARWRVRSVSSLMSQLELHSVLCGASLAGGLVTARCLLQGYTAVDHCNATSVRLECRLMVADSMPLSVHIGVWIMRERTAHSCHIVLVANECLSSSVCPGR